MLHTGRWAKRLLPILALAAAALYQYSQDQPHPDASQATSADRGDYNETRSWQAGEWIVIQARVRRLLSDDLDGSRHQRFIVELPDRRTLLVAHNIDLARRVPLDVGDNIKLRGQFEPNERGGVLHWTHHDPDGRTDAGWIEHRNSRYQ